MTTGLVTHSNKADARRGVAARRGGGTRGFTAGFTLVELMVSIVLMLILILGINQVFKLTSDTISATNSLSAAIRTNRAVQGAMFDDVKHSVLPRIGQGGHGPFLVIQSERLAAFNSAVEAQNDRDYNVASTNQQTIDDAIMSEDVDGDNNEANDPFSRVALSGRNHRIDQLLFFARDLYRRQTGNDGTYCADMTSSEALIWYGHLKQPATANTKLSGALNPGHQNTSALGSSPGTASNNDNNFYARQWILGRFATLLVEPSADPSGPPNSQARYAWSTNGQKQVYIRRDPTMNGDTARRSLQPLIPNSSASVDGVSTYTDIGETIPTQNQFGRFDLAGTTIAAYEQILVTAIDSSLGNNSHYNDWWDVGSTGIIFRYGGLPYPTKPMSAQGAARTAPCFVPACTQFAVEYAGDFITQVTDPNSADFGKATSPVPDGTTDFIVDQIGSGPKTVRARWYGFPRNVYTADDTGGRETIICRTTGLGNINQMKDVIPLRDVLSACPPWTPPHPGDVRPKIPNPSDHALFERVFPLHPTGGDYGAAGALPYDARYVCAWQPTGTYREDPSFPVNHYDDPPLPSMLRLVVGIDDPDGKLSSTQLYEYVIDLPR